MGERSDDHAVRLGERIVQACEDLRTTQEAYRDLIEHINDVVFTTDAAGTLTFVSPQVRQLLGYDPQELAGRHFADLIHPDDLPILQQAFAEVMLGKLYPIDLRILAKSGQYRWIRASSRPIVCDGRIAGISGIGVDIHERKLAEEELRSQGAKLRALTASLETTVVRERQRIAADLHDHVGQVLGLARLEISTIAPPRSRPEQRAAWRNAKRHIDQAVRFARTLSAELHPPVLRQLGVGPALRWLARETSSKVGIPISCRIVGPAVQLDGDTATYIYGAAQELVRNAVRHGRPKRIFVTFRRDARTVRLRVRDDGAGFDASRVDGPGPAKGFGLFSLSERTVAMGGSLALDTAPGKGTSVEITVPVRPG
jgi:PAS domain S-box-containing protein